VIGAYPHTTYTVSAGFEAAAAMTNKLFYGDNLDVLRASVPSESVDLERLGDFKGEDGAVRPGRPFGFSR
jgi:hypothetical protein